MSSEQAQNTKNLKFQLISIYQKYHTLLKTEKYSKNSKTFVNSTTYAFLEELIHLHCQEIKNLIKKVCIDSISEKTMNILQELQAYASMQIEFLNETSSKRTVFENLEKIVKAYLLNECKEKTTKQKDDISLEIQCSLNYTCPRCLKSGEK